LGGIQDPVVPSGEKANEVVGLAGPPENGDGRPGEVGEIPLGDCDTDPPVESGFNEPLSGTLVIIKTDLLIDVSKCL
jgi:hypothetical protein